MQNKLSNNHSEIVFATASSVLMKINLHEKIKQTDKVRIEKWFIEEFQDLSEKVDLINLADKFTKEFASKLDAATLLMVIDLF